MLCRSTPQGKQGQQVRVDIQLFTRGGESILRMIERQNYDTLSKRPVLSKAAKVALMLRAAAGKIIPTRVRQGQTRNGHHD